MVLKRFSFLVILRIILILGNVVLIAFIFGDARLFFNQIILAIFLAAQIADLIRYVNKTNRELVKFLNAIKQSDFSMTFSQNSAGKSFNELFQAFETIINSYKKVKIEREAQYLFLQKLVDHIHVGIIAVENKDKLVLLNNSARKLLEIPELRNWKGLEARSPDLIREVKLLEPEGRKLVEISAGNSKKNLSLDVSSIQLIGENNILITFQDIKSEIEQTEVEAWHKLIRILTHEIMNSVTPISSLTETMQMVLRKENKIKQAFEINDETIEDLAFSLETIQKRSDSLLSFVDSYRKLTKVPRPIPGPVNTKELLEGSIKLLEAEINKNKIAVSIECNDPPIEIYLDRSLVEQVLINLITNAVHALEGIENPKLILRSYAHENRRVIQITDNGAGIEKKELDQIFIPFYSTKKTGSGIGLSLSKQVMSLHHGNIRVESLIGKGTTFFLEFRSNQGK